MTTLLFLFILTFVIVTIIVSFSVSRKRCNLRDYESKIKPFEKDNNEPLLEDNVEEKDTNKNENSVDELVLGSQWYMGLLYHMEEALEESKMEKERASCNPEVAIFSKKYYEEINKLNHEKIYDFCFIGSLKSNFEARKWVVDFAKKFFTEKSIFINTDSENTFGNIGVFDYSHVNFWFCPKEKEDNQSKKVQYRVVEENKEYFEKMCKSKFVLCPAGDAPWSFRFYEVLMCESVPVVESWHHTYRTKEESTIKYKYLLNTSFDDKNLFDIFPYEDYVKENTKIFKHHHLNPFLTKPALL